MPDFLKVFSTRSCASSKCGLQNLFVLLPHSGISVAKNGVAKKDSCIYLLSTDKYFFLTSLSFIIYSYLNPGPKFHCTNDSLVPLVTGDTLCHV